MRKSSMVVKLAGVFFAATVALAGPAVAGDKEPPTDPKTCEAGLDAPNETAARSRCSNSGRGEVSEFNEGPLCDPADVDPGNSGGLNNGGDGPDCNS